MIRPQKPVLAGYIRPERGLIPPFGGFQAHDLLGGTVTPAENRAHPRQVIGGKGKNRLRGDLLQTAEFGLA